MIIQNNKNYKIGTFSGTYDMLPKGTYRLRWDDMTKDFYLVKVEDFILPSKLYGSSAHIDRILNTFQHSSKNLAVLFAGTKGAGKSIDAKRICVQSNLPIILIDQCFYQTELINFLSSPELGSCVVLIDEYEKLYTRHEETIMLQILDGACNSRHLFVLTVNNMLGINDNLVNRPSRIFYRKVYDKVPTEVILEILDNELKNPKWKNEMIEVLDKFAEITFDIIMALVREVNLYDESPLECAKLMNFVSQPIYVEVTQVFPNGTMKKTENLTLYGSDAKEVELCVCESPEKGADFQYNWFPLSEIKKVENHWELVDDAGNKFIFTKTSKINFMF